MSKVTFSVIKADVGGLAGHHAVVPEELKVAEASLAAAQKSGLLLDHYVTAVGDDIQLIMTHRKGPESKEIHDLAWRTFKEVTDKVSKPMKLYGAGQDLLSDAFSGNLRGMGPGYAEGEFEERPSEPVLAMMADKTEPGAWNWPLYKIFADPMSTPGLVIDSKMRKGFVFRVMDMQADKFVDLKAPEESYEILALLGTTGRYAVQSIWRRADNELAAVSSTSRLSFMAGRYVGKDDPCMFIRVQAGFPATGEALDPFAFPHLVAGWTRGSHIGPLMPVGLKDAKCTRFDGPPRVVALGFQITDGKLIGPADMFDDIAYDRARQEANRMADFMRQHGPFMPHRLGPEEMEYTQLNDILKSLESRMKPSAEMLVVPA
ncbi:MAG: fructose 1,6-bisphosphatase [Nitrososphaerota archaeon]|nr:fructose 1,6-bisphosphatase [Nitrososphaerota archaeon]